MVKFVATAFVKSSLGLLTCKINAVVYRIFQHVQLLFDHTSEQTKAAVFLLTVLLSKHFVDTTDDDHLLVDNNVAQWKQWMEGHCTGVQSVSSAEWR